MKHQNLKSLQVRKSQVLEEVDNLVKEKEFVDKKLNDEKNRLKPIENNIKRLSKSKLKISRKIEDLFEEKKSIDRKLNDTRDHLRLIEGNIEKLTKLKPQLSEHAILRYLERIKEINISEVKEEIMTDKIKQQISTIGNGRIPVGDFVLVIRNNVVVTIEK